MLPAIARSDETAFDLESELIRSALDALDVAVFVLSADRSIIRYRNRAAVRLFPTELPEKLRDAIDGVIEARQDISRLAASSCAEVGGRSFFVRIKPIEGPPRGEVVMLREQLTRDADMWRLLQSRYGVSRREYLILGCLRLGRTNRETADELGIAEGTAARHIHRLLERFSVPNRTRLVDVVERLVSTAA